MTFRKGLFISGDEKETACILMTCIHTLCVPEASKSSLADISNLLAV
jgi:hypothetical protein